MELAGDGAENFMLLCWRCIDKETGEMWDGDGFEGFSHDGGVFAFDLGINLGEFLGVMGPGGEGEREDARENAGEGACAVGSWVDCIGENDVGKVLPLCRNWK